jgi:hypothetical protein
MINFQTYIDLDLTDLNWGPKQVLEVGASYCGTLSVYRIIVIRNIK